MKSYLPFLFFALITGNLFSQFEISEDKEIGGYLFMHMTSEDYGGLYYSVSEDGLNWELLNEGNTVEDKYRGHPDVCVGHDGRFYMIGVEKGTGKLPMWVSNDLVEWSNEFELPAELFDGSKTEGFRSNPLWYGAPKMFFDTKTETYIITWHSTRTGLTKEDPADYWCNMRTFYVTTTDFKDYSDPQRLYGFEMGTIDVIIRSEGGMYYAFLKDECEATVQWPTGKSIRVAVSRNLTGPYAYPSGSISPSYHEAPTIIPKPDKSGYYMYYEQYPGVQYGVSEAPTMAGPWFKVWGRRVSVPVNARHGCMLELSPEQIKNIKKTFKNE